MSRSACLLTAAVMSAALANTATRAQGLSRDIYASGGSYLQCVPDGAFYKCQQLIGRPQSGATLLRPDAGKGSTGSLGNVVGGAAASGSAFKAYQFSNTGTLLGLQQEMRAVGLSEAFIGANSSKLFSALKAQPTRAGLAMVVIGGAGYTIYNLWKGDKK